jgi:hypothetical protein
MLDFSTFLRSLSIIHINFVHLFFGHKLIGTLCDMEKGETRVPVPVAHDDGPWRYNHCLADGLRLLRGE